MPLVGILVLNYHHPVETAQCVASLLLREPASTRILWLENDAEQTREALMACLAEVEFPWLLLEPATDPVPPAGTVGVVLCPENLGYAGGNNVGLHFLARHGVPYGWVLNNDTQLIEGSSRDLVQAARARPGVGAWGTRIVTEHPPAYLGGIILPRDFAIRLATSPADLEAPLAFVSGCSLFLPMEIAARVGYLPDDYFLYYEDPSFSLSLKRAGFAIAGLDNVVIRHLESLSTGTRSPLMEFYSHRNRWYFIERFFPEHLARQQWRNWYTFQKYFLRGKFAELYVQFLAYWDYRHGRLGRTDRPLSRIGRG